MILVVFLLRSFLFEPFKIPSGSMMPTLLVGDLILVNKFHYGVRLPVINKKIIANNDPQRGDVMVFRYPPDPSIDYIKRVVGVPGDEVAYLNQKLTINGQPVELQPQGRATTTRTRCATAPQFREKLGGVPAPHPGRSATRSAFSAARVTAVSACRENCRYSAEGVVVQGAAGPLLHDGRQPRQFAGLALLGLRAGREHRRQGVLRLDEFRQLSASASFQ